VPEHRRSDIGVIEERPWQVDPLAVAELEMEQHGVNGGSGVDRFFALLDRALPYAVIR
jgi:hypothetical protein